jgi:hypothetical protein
MHDVPAATSAQRHLAHTKGDLRHHRYWRDGYCQAHEVARAHETGVSLDKISEIHDFERSNLYTEAERAALRLALAAGQHPNSATRRHFEELRRHYDDGQIVEIVAVVAAFEFLNRRNETMATDLEPEPLALAQKTHIGLGWEPGRHAPAPRAG